MRITSRMLTFLTSGKRVGELILNPKLRQEISNWWLLLADFINPQKRIYTLNLRGEKRLMLRGGTFDKWPVSEIIVRDDYHLRTLLPTPKIIIDLGAGIGEFCLYASLLFPKVKIYAYEPDRETYQLLLQNLKTNKLAGHVYPFKLAVAKKNSPEQLYINQTKGYAKLINLYPRAQLLQTTSLDRIFSLNKIQTCDLLKIDIEGAEYAVLYSFSPALFKKIRHIHMECHNFASTAYNSKSMQQFLENNGFIVEERTSFDRAISMLFATSLLTTSLLTRRVD